MHMEPIIHPSGQKIRSSTLEKDDTVCSNTKQHEIGGKPTFNMERENEILLRKICCLQLIVILGVSFPQRTTHN